MRKFMFFLVAVAVSMAAAAQQTDKQMATLQHGDKTSVYYGIDAFVQAYNDAADTLDVITLSSGEFNVPVQISKSIAVYGAGFEDDTKTNAERTFLKNGITLKHGDKVDEDGQTNVAAVKVNGVRIEGIYCDGGLYISSNGNEPIHNLTLSKCSFSGVDFGVESYNCVIRQCRISGAIHGKTTTSYVTQFPGCTANNLLIANSYLDSQVYGFYESSTVLIDHCIYWGATASFTVYTPYTFTNNVSYVDFPSGSVSYNNVFITSQDKAQGDYGGLDSHGNSVGVENKTFFAEEGEDGTYAPYKTFALRYPDLYRGTDGTEIGLHGGTYAWNKIPCIPRITECTIDTKDAANGTIKLSIKAEAQTKE